LVRPMSRSSVLTSQQSVRRPPLVAAGRAERYERMAAGSVLAFAVSWLTYTRFYFWLQPRHLTYDGPFMYLTGKPDPACGLTRTFAWMWRGDLVHAAGVYPLGPLLFIATLAVVAYSAVVLVSGSVLRIALPSFVQRSILIVALVALGLNWAAKWFWLGM
jgi:hypothetical protein